MEDYTHFTEEALKAQDGKSIPLTAYPGGPVVVKQPCITMPRPKL